MSVETGEMRRSARAAAPTRRRSSAAVRNVAKLCVVPVATIIVWYILSALIFVVPQPLSAFRELVDLLGTSAYRGQFVDTLVKTAVAFVIAGVLGSLIGLALGLFAKLRGAFEPLVLIANGIPKIVFYPVLLILFGLTGASQTTMGVIFGTLPVIVNLMAALADMRPVYRKLARTLEVGRIRSLLHVYLPAVGSMFMVALQLGFSLTILGVVYAELIASRSGLGQEIIGAYSSGQYPTMSASILAVLIIAVGGTVILRIAGRLAFPAH